MLSLKNVTLISIDGVNPELTTKALLKSSEEIEFGAIKLLSFRRPRNLKSKIEFIKIPKLTLGHFQLLSVKRLYDFVNTKFCLSIQPDGFIINPNRWPKRSVA